MWTSRGKKSIFFHGNFLQAQDTESIQIFFRTRYGSKDEVLYIGCYNRVVWDTENLSILDLVKSQMIGLGGQYSLPPYSEYKRSNPSRFFSCDRYKLKDYDSNFVCYYQEVRDTGILLIVAPVITQCPSLLVGVSLF